jgi:hypothetical protein
MFPSHTPRQTEVVRLAIKYKITKVDETLTPAEKRKSGRKTTAGTNNIGGSPKPNVFV